MDNKNISFTEAKEILKNNKKSYLIDVRSRNEYTDGFINGALNMPVEVLESLDIDKDSYLILYGRSGYSKDIGQEKLMEKGYKHVYNAGGVFDYKGELE